MKKLAERWAFPERMSVLMFDRNKRPPPTMSNVKIIEAFIYEDETRGLISVSHPAFTFKDQRPMMAQYLIEASLFYTDDHQEALILHIFSALIKKSHGLFVGCHHKFDESIPEPIAKLRHHEACIRHMRRDLGLWQGALGREDL